MKEVTSKRLAILAACGLVVLLVAVMVAPAVAVQPWVFVQQTSPAAVSLTGGDAVDENHVWASGGNATICFWNGSSWVSQPNPGSGYTPVPFFGALGAADANNAWAVGDDLTILKWNGTAWIEQYRDLGGPALYGCEALNATNVWAVGASGTIWYHDGTTWVNDNPGGGIAADLRSASALDVNNVWAAGYAGNTGYIYKRTSGSWNTTPVYTTPTEASIRSVCAVDATHFWAVGNAGTIYFSSDGTNWAPHAQSGVITDRDLHMVKATSPDNVWAAGSNNTVINFDGTTWTSFPTPDSTSAHRTALPTPTAVWVTGNGGKIFKGGRMMSISKCEPNWGAQGETMNVKITAVNTSFVDGTSAMTFSGKGIKVNSTTVNSPTTATANITIAADATPGDRTVNVVTGDDVPIPLANGFRVRATHTINATAGKGGKIEPSGAVKVIEPDNSPTFAITPDAGYHVTDVAVDGVSMGDITSHQFKKVTSSHAITASFSDQYSTWYLAEGSSAWGLSAAINITNPSDDGLNAKLTYMLSDGTTKEQTVGLPATSQVTVNPSDTIGESDFSTKVECVQGKTIAVDRAMSWSSSGTQFKGSHSSIGVTAPNTNWYLPEGSSKWGFETWLLIQNPSDVEASCDVTYMIEDVGPKAVNHKIAPKSRATFNMVDEIGEADASIQVASNVGVIPERAMYNAGPESGGSFNKREGHDSIGTTRPAKDFFLAEGTTAWGFTTYVLIQNPDTKAANVTLTFMSNEGALEPMKLTMPAQSRKTVRVNDTYPNKDLSIKVSGDKPIIAERSMFWAPGQPTGQEAMHDSIGVSSAHKTWILPDGQVGLPDDVETFTLVQNPNDTDVQIKVSYLKAGGGDPVTFTDTVKANSRKTYNLADSLTDGGSASILVETVTSGKKVIAERAMYIDGRWSGNDTIGGWTD